MNMAGICETFLKDTEKYLTSYLVASQGREIPEHEIQTAAAYITNRMIPIMADVMNERDKDWRVELRRNRRDVSEARVEPVEDPKPIKLDFNAISDKYRKMMEEYLSGHADFNIDDRTINRICIYTESLIAFATGDAVMAYEAELDGRNKFDISSISAKYTKLMDEYLYKKVTVSSEAARRISIHTENLLMYAMGDAVMAYEADLNKQVKTPGGSIPLPELDRIYADAREHAKAYIDVNIHHLNKTSKDEFARHIADMCKEAVRNYYEDIKK